MTRVLDTGQDERKGISSLNPLVFLAYSYYQSIRAEADVIKL
jgi:hypothetical protein